MRGVSIVHSRSTVLVSVLLLTAVLFFCSEDVRVSSADEGMWEIDRLGEPLLASMQARGLALNRGELVDLEGGGLVQAVIDLGHGTGSFVSSEGLILTNYHVAYGALQEISVGGPNLIEDGFVAAGQAEEIPARGLKASIPIAVEDVTDRVLGAVDESMSDVDRQRAISERRREIVEAAERGRSVECQLVAFFGGLEYKLFTYLTLRDVRVVAAPPRAIGLYGGEVDNFMWPRHSGDFCFLRAYVGPNGNPAEYAEENVPYRPEVILPVSTAGYSEGSLTLIPGYPARTMRYRSTASLEYYQDFLYPRQITQLTDVLAIMKDAAAGDRDAALKMTALELRYGNAAKYYQGLLDGFQRGGLKAKRVARENELAAWVASDPEMNRLYGDVLPRIAELYDDIRAWREKRQLLRSLQRQCLLLEAASLTVRWAEEREKPDSQRGRGYRERDLPHLEEHLRSVDAGFVDRVDRRILEYYLDLSRELPKGQRIEALDRLIAAAAGENEETRIAAVVRELYENTEMGTKARREELFQMTAEELDGQQDPFLELARDLCGEEREIEAENEAFNSAISRLRPLLLEANQRWQGRAMYPDANGTPRVTFGRVRGYSPRDGVWFSSQTSLGGVIEKDSGQRPFDCPLRLKQLSESGDLGPYGNADGDKLPVNFLTDNDTRGGNSGSPVLNGDGEIVGVTFDGNYESMAADYQFDDKLTRTINVDIRYVLFVLDKLMNARGVLEEIGPRGKSPS